MKLKPKKSNPPIPKFIYTLSPDVKPIHEQNSNPNLKIYIYKNVLQKKITMKDEVKTQKIQPTNSQVYLYPISRCQTNSWAKFQPQSEVIKTPKSNPFRVDFKFLFFHSSSNPPTLLQYTTKTQPRSKETKNSNPRPRRPPKKIQFRTKASAEKKSKTEKRALSRSFYLFPSCLLGNFRIIFCSSSYPF